MKIAIFYDTETQGLPLWSEPSEHPEQPHIVQLAALLVNLQSREVLDHMDVIIKPDGWTIPQETTNIHGISTERALAEGIPEHEALEQFMALWQKAVTRVAHNESFDARILRIACKRFIDPLDDGTAEKPFSDIWKVGPSECTQILATPILKLPPTEKMKAARRNHHKSANLREAFEFFMGRPMENAHNAMADVMACKDVYFAILDHKAREADPLAA
jgi:DNA polymerase-3 subunit epsilon